jgi:PIN domain nuclease of toxin-antitoxin system
MNCLLDTHAFLWALFDRSQLSGTATSAILDSENTIYVSVITFWEISLKYNLGKLSLSNVLPEELPEYAEKSGFEILAITPSEAASFHKLPKIIHKDPFDRLIIWQCICNNINMISKDSKIAEYSKYGLKITW